MLEYLDTIIAFAAVMLGFSLLITIANQIISAFLGYRGSNLRWGVQTMLSTLDPELSDHAKVIATKLLSHPIVSDSVFTRYNWKIPLLGGLLQRWKLASAIGPDTFVRTLKTVAEDLKKDKRQGQKSVGDKIDELLGDLDPGTHRRLDQVKNTIGKTLHGMNYSIQFDDLLKQLGNSAQQSVGKIEAWFNIAMNRVSQRFTMQIRIWTVAFAFLLAFGIHLDSFNLFNQFLGNPALRQQVVSQSETFLKEADSVLGSATGSNETNELNVSPDVLVDQMKQLIVNDIDKSKEAKPTLLEAIPSFITISDAEKWLRDNLTTGVTEDRFKELAAKYKGRVINGLRAKSQAIAELLQKSNIELVPGNRKLADLKNPITFFFGFDGIKNFLGVLFSAGLLALGAPFWYNMLKTLANLRPMVATRQDQQKHEAGQN